MTSTDPEIVDLSPTQKRQLLSRLLRGGAEVGNSGAPLSFSQERLWFLEQLMPGNAAYNMSSALLGKGPLSPRAVRQSFGLVIERHEALRTRFVMRDGRPRQEIEAVRLLLRVADLSALSREAALNEARRLAAEEALRGFDLSTGPLLRATLLHLSASEHVLLLTLHHIVCDGWSLSLLISELMSTYQAVAAGQAPSRPPLAWQYADYTHWQRQNVAGERLAQLLDYWRKQVEGVPVLELPTDHPRPARLTYRGAYAELVLEAEWKTQLEQFARKQGATLYMLLLAGFQLLLSRYSGQSRVLVGTPIAGRSRLEWEELVGFFVNTLVLGGDTSGDPTTEEWIQRTRQMCLNAYSHQDLPLEKLVEECQPERDLSRHPLFQVMFVLQNTPAASIATDTGLQWEPLPDLQAPPTAKFDLTLIAQPEPDRLRLLLEYSTDLYEPSTAARLLRHYRQLLSEMLAYPDWPLTSLSMLDPAERQHLLVEWNQTSRPVASPAFIHQLFEEQAQRNPGATALMSSSGSRTYAELNDKANRIGHQLRNYGLRQGEPICILLDRSVEMIEAVLGVVKAGGAYVPLDPSQPSLRHQAILTSLRARFLITSAEVAGTGGWLESVDTLHHVVCIGQSSKDVSAYIGNLHISNASALDSHPLSHLTPIGSSGQPAYIIFTSGSTGTPKGVVVTHAALLNLIDWANTTFDIGPADRGIVISSLSFDLSVYDIFGLLGGGASLYVATKEELRDPERVISLLRENSITFWNSAPGAIQQLVPLWPESESFDNLRLVFLSGDWIPVRLPDQIRRRARNANVIGLGGATEATVWSNFFCIKDVDPAWASIPYGRPIQNSQYFILDRNLLPCPLGVPGNLYIAGECLALGYWQEPVLTAQQFVPNPFGARPGERLYATGDLARHKDDGNLEFLGRTDHQVKIRGFRVEISEVEAALRQHPLVSAVIVLAQQDRDRSRRLIAYIVPVNEAELVGADQLRAILQQRLPEYMIPSAFITIASFPLTSNGKVDLVALQKLAPSPSGARRSTLSHTEEAVASIWSTLLGIEDIGQDDNFFALGGHSILATEMISQIRRCLRRNVSLLSIFEAPTLGAFSNKVAMCIAAAATNRTFASHLVAIQSNGDRQPLFLVHPIGGGVSCYADLARALGPTQPLYAFEAEELSRLTPDVRRYETLEILASNYVNTLLDAEPRGPYLLGGWSFGGIVAFEMARQLHARGRSDIILFLLDSKPPLALPSYDDTTLALGLATELAQQAGKPLKLSHEEFSRLALDERWSVLLFRLKSNKLVPTNTDASALMQIVAGFRVREKCARNYVPGIYSGRLTLFRATERNLNMPKPGNLDDTYGWAQYCTQPIEVIHVPGSHATIGLEPNVAVVADRIRQQIELTTFIKLA